MGSYKEIYEVEFITRTKEIVNDYMKQRGQYKLTLLLNCLVGLVILPSERTPAGAPPAWKSALAEFQVLKDEGIKSILEPNSEFTFGNFVKKMRNGIAHQHIEPINTDNSFTGVRIWNIGRGGKRDFEIVLTRRQLQTLANLIADQYLLHLSRKEQTTIIEGSDG